MIKNFDWKFYINYYSDLKDNNIKNEDEAYQHWIHNGLYEDRIIQRNMYFDWNFYLELYPDLKENNINDEKTSKKHWENYGKNENRICNDTLLIKEFILEPEEYILKKKYVYNSNIEDYCKKYAKHARVFYEKNNYVDIDLYFYKIANKLDLHTTHDLLYHFHTNYNGLIYHPKQLLNIYPTIKYYKICKDILVKYNKKEYKLSEFIEIMVYNKDYQYFSNLLLKNIENKLCSSSLLLLVFIGNYDIGINLINKIIQYKNFEKFNISFCFNNQEIIDKLFEIINNNFENYAIYLNSELGNDIVPTLLMYDDIIKKYTYKYIIKLQTKSNINIFNQLTDFLLMKKLKNLLTSFKQYSNCINHYDFYLRIENDLFNKKLYNKYDEYIDKEKSFVTGTIFFTKSSIFNKVLLIMKENYKECFLNNMYDNNCTFFEDSYIHFLERLFGIIK